MTRSLKEEPRVDQSGAFPTKFEIPTREVTLAEFQVRYQAYHAVTELNIAVPGAKTVVRPGFKVAEQHQLGEAFYYMGAMLDGLNGSYTTPHQLYALLEPQDMGEKEASALLLGGQVSGDKPILTLKARDGYTTVNVFGGSTSYLAQTISEVGNRGEFTLADRRFYQHAMYGVALPIAVRAREQTKHELDLDSDEPIVHVIEDCAASVITLEGLDRIMGATGVVSSGRRIDVVAATGHALALLALDSQERGRPTEVNVGFLGWGLSRGIGPNLEHKNYVTFAPIPELLKVHNGRIFAVGDMGTGAMRAGLLPDSYRQDRWGMNGADDAAEYTFTQNLQERGDLVLGLEKGGLAVVAMAKHALSQAGRDWDVATIMLVGKRLDSPEQGFTARFDKILGPLATYKAHNR